FKLYTNTLTIIRFGIGTAFLCGIIATLILSMCMQGFKKDKGIASSVQSAIKMFFTGVGLIIFSYNQLESIVNPRLYC
ncbi:multidrug transporter, partial [Francisella tularensis subsp. holarctica]|uniref:multidrug transporter n=1 Tax=Francisella tularensis TaxID=263 RepID=UPI002381D068